MGEQVLNRFFPGAQGADQPADKSLEQFFTAKQAQNMRDDKSPKKPQDLIAQTSKALKGPELQSLYLKNRCRIGVIQKRLDKYNNQTYLSLLDDYSKRAVIEEMQETYLYLLADYQKQLNQGKLSKRFGLTSPKRLALEGQLLACLNILGYLHWGAPLNEPEAQAATAPLNGQLTAAGFVDPTFTHSGLILPPGFELKDDGSYRFNPLDEDYQALKVNDSLKYSIPITVTAEDDKTSAFTINLIVTGTKDTPIAQIEVIKNVPDKLLSFASDIKRSLYHYWNEDNFIPYVAKLIVDGLRACLVESITNPTGASRDFLSEINGHRLYWVWSGGLLNSMIPFLADSLQTTRLSNEINAPNRVTGYVSFILYYLRLFINCSLVIKHTLGIGVSEEEKNLGAWTRFKHQVDDKGIVIANDIVWGFANMWTFLYWTYSVSVKAGIKGDIMTVLLLGVDFAITCFAYYKDKKAFNKQLSVYQTEINDLNMEIGTQNGLARDNKAQILKTLKGDDDSEQSSQHAEEKFQRLLQYVTIINNTPEAIKNIALEEKALEELYEIENKQQALEKIDVIITANEQIGDKHNALKQYLFLQWALKRELATSHQIINESLMLSQVRAYQEASEGLRTAQKRMDTVLHDKQSYVLDWKYQRKEHLNFMVYSLTMCLALSLILLPLFPVFPIAPVVVGLVASALLFGLTLLNGLTTGYHAIQKTAEQKRNNSQRIETLRTEFIILQHIEKIHVLQNDINFKEDETGDKQKELDSLKAEYPGYLIGLKKQTGDSFGAKKLYYDNLLTDSALPPRQLENERKLLFLDMKQLSADNDYQAQLAKYHKICTIRAMVFDCAIPAAVFACAFLMPLGVGLPVMAAVFVIGILSKMFINYAFKPKKAADEEVRDAKFFDATDSNKTNTVSFNEFDDNPSLAINQKKAQPNKAMTALKKRDSAPYEQNNAFTASIGYMYESKQLA